MIPVTLNPDSKAVEIGVYGTDYKHGYPDTITLYLGGYEFSLSRSEAGRLAEAIDSSLKGWDE